MTERVRTALVCVPAYLAVFAAGWGITQLDAQKQALEVLLLAAGALVVGMAAGWSIAQIWVRRYLEDGRTGPLWKIGFLTALFLFLVLLVHAHRMPINLHEIVDLSFLAILVPECGFCLFLLVYEADATRLRRALRVLAVWPLVAGAAGAIALVASLPAGRIVPEPGEPDALFDWADVRDAVAAFPVDVTESIDAWGAPVVEFGPVPTGVPNERVDDVVDAATAVATLDGRPVALLGYVCVEPGTAEHLYDVKGFRSWDGKPAPRPDGLTASLTRNAYAYAYEFYLEVDRALHAKKPSLDFAQLHGRGLPGGSGYGSSMHNVDEQTQRISIHTAALPLFPDAGELRIGLSWGEPTALTIAAITGSVVHTASDAIQVLAIRDGYRSFSSSYGRVSSGPFVGRLTMDKQSQRAHEGSWTSMVLYIASGQSRRYFDPEVITVDGRTLTSNGSGWSGSLYNFQVRCASNEIRAIRFYESPHRTEIRFRLPNLAGAPESSAARRNLLAARIPVFLIRQTWDVEGFLRGVFQHQLESRPMAAPVFPGVARQGALPQPIEHHNWTVRQLLDRYYPHQWEVQDNDLQLGLGVQPSVLGQIRLALDALKRSE